MIQAKKIGLDIRLYGTLHGGIGRYCQQLLPELLRMDKENEYFLFFNPKTTGPDDLARLERLAKSAAYPSGKERAHLVKTGIRHYSLGEQTAFYRTLNRLALDLVHFPNFNFPVMYQGPFVVTIHDMVHHKIGGAKRSHWLHFLAYKRVIAAAARRAKKIITVSEYSKKDIVNLLQVPETKIQVIYEGVSLQNSVTDEAAARVKRLYLLDKPYFLFVGVLERKKNLTSLTRGFDVLLKKYHSDMHLAIVDKSDSHYPEVRHKAADISFADRLVFTGRVDDDELQALYQGAYAFVSASLHEGFGLPGVEALHFGLPLAVSNIGVFNEIYDNAAVYFNPLDPDDIAEKLHLLVRDKQFYGQMQHKALERSLLFDWKKTGEQTVEVYRSTLPNN